MLKWSSVLFGLLLLTGSMVSSVSARPLEALAIEQSIVGIIPVPTKRPGTSGIVELESLEEALETNNLKLGQQAFVRIFKAEAELEIWLKDKDGYQLLKTWPICKFSGDPGPKLKEGDHQSPEGFYVVTKKQLNPNSRYHLAFNVGFPNEYDRAHRRTGSALMVHGDCLSVGCYAMTDDGIEEIYEVVEQALEHGQKRVPVHIFPFRMTDLNMRMLSTGKWSRFWRNLKKGYDLFEEENIPPVASVCGKRYRFNRTSSFCKQIAGW